KCMDANKPSFTRRSQTTLYRRHQRIIRYIIMNKGILLLIFSLLFMLQSCNQKKLKEVVEVPLPAAEEKRTLGHPDAVKADPGAFSIAKLNYAYDELAPHIDALTME